jgi:hypothetical protein
MNQTYNQDWLWRHFVDEFQVRAFSGEWYFPKSQASSNEQNFPCAYGGKYGGGVSPAGGVNEDRLRRAQAALSKFDLVLLMETMGSQARMVADFLGVPLQNASLANNAAIEQNNSKNKARSITVDEIAKYAPRAHRLLQDATRFESRLYDHAVSLNRDIYKKWMNMGGLFGQCLDKECHYSRD